MNTADKQKYLALNIEDFTKDLLEIDSEPLMHGDCDNNNICGLMHANGQCCFGYCPFGSDFFNADRLDVLDYITRRMQGQTDYGISILKSGIMQVLKKYEPYLRCRGDWDAKSKTVGDVIKMFPQTFYDVLNMDLIRQEWNYACILDNGKDIDLGGTYTSMQDPQQIMESKQIIAQLYDMLKSYEARINRDAAITNTPDDIQMLKGICDTYHKEVEYLTDTPTASTTQPKDGTDEKPKAHFNCRMTDEELTRIFEQLKQSGFIASDSVSNDWLYIFKGGKDRTATAKIMWIAKNKRTRQPNKKSLLDLLVLMGLPEKDIRSNINGCFTVESARNYASKDYTRYRDWHKDIESEYHKTLIGIIQKAKQGKK